MKYIKKFLPIIAVIIVVGAGSFYGGMKYGQTKSFAGPGSNGEMPADFQNFSDSERQQMAQRMSSIGGTLKNRTSGGGISGEILSKDDKSITVKSSNGSSKIVFYSETTEVGKFVSGISSDLEVGKTVMVSGISNQDGSITAKSIQLRPEMSSQPQ